MFLFCCPFHSISSCWPSMISVISHSSHSTQTLGWPSTRVTSWEVQRFNPPPPPKKKKMTTTLSQGQCFRREYHNGLSQFTLKSRSSLPPLKLIIANQQRVHLSSAAADPLLIHITSLLVSAMINNKWSTKSNQITFITSANLMITYEKITQIEFNQKIISCIKTGIKWNYKMMNVLKTLISACEEGKMLSTINV